MRLALDPAPLATGRTSPFGAGPPGALTALLCRRTAPAYEVS